MSDPYAAIAAPDPYAAIASPAGSQAPPSSPPSTLSDVWKSFKGGVVRSIAAIPGMVGDLGAIDYGGVYQAHKAQAEAATADALRQGKITPQQASQQTAKTQAAFDAVKDIPAYNPYGTQDYIDHAPQAVQDTANYQPQTTAGKFAGAVGGFVPALIPGKAEVEGVKDAASLIGFGAKQIAKVVAGGVGSEAAGEATEAAGGGQTAQTIARLVGGVGGFSAPSLAEGAVNATKAAAQRSPFMAAVDPEAAEQQAGSAIAARATDPAAVQTSLSQPAEIVPGSTPTTFQQTGDPGLGTLEREVATQKPELFNQRRADQNGARVSALADIQADADPNDVAKAVKAQFDDLDASTQAHIDDLRATAEGKTEALGGQTPPEGSGETLRASINQAENTARSQERGLWQAVDPNGDLTGNVSQTVSAAKEIAGAVSKTAKPMDGEEGAIFDVAQSMPALAPVSDLIDLRSRVSTEMRNELATNGSSPSYARLSRLRGAIQDNLSTTIAHQFSNDAAAVGRGALDPDETAYARVKDWAQNFYDQRAARTVNQEGPGGGYSSPGPSGGAGNDGAGFSQVGRPGGPASDQGLQGNDPTFDADAASRLEAATAATKARAGIFNPKPVGTVTERDGSANTFKLPDGEVPRKFFHPGPTGFSDMQALFKAVGQDKALPVIEDYATTTLRHSAIKDGLFDQAAYERWKKAFAHSLRALPEETRAKFEDAASASNTVSDAVAAKTAAMKDAKAGAIGKVMSLESAESVTNAVGRILNGSKPVEEMLQLAKATAKDPAARAGLRQAVADHITGKLFSNTEAGTSGINLISADKFQTFMRRATPALKLIFKPEEVESMQAVADDIQRSKRSENTKLAGGSNTAQDLMGASGHAAVRQSLLGVAIKAAAGTIGAVTHGTLGAMGAVFGTQMVQTLRAAGISRVDQLVTEAMLHPEVAKRLLLKVSEPVPPAATAALSKALMAAQLSTWSVGGRRQDQETRPSSEQIMNMEPK